MTLAQIGAGADGAGAVPRLPDPPLVAHFLLENPWPLAAGLAVGGVFAFFLLNQRGRLKDGLRLLALGVLLAAGVVGAGLAVTTEREVLQERTKELVELAVAARVGELRGMLTERVAVRAFSMIPSPRGRDEVLGAVEQNLKGQWAVTEHEIGSIQATVDGPNVARTQVRVWARLGGEKGFMPGAWFRIDWTRDGDGPWKAAGVTVLQVDGLGINTQAL